MPCFRNMLGQFRIRISHLFRSYWQPPRKFNSDLDRGPTEPRRLSARNDAFPASRRHIQRRTICKPDSAGRQVAYVAMRTGADNTST